MATTALNMADGLTLKEAARRLHKSIHWLRQNRIRLGIPHVKIGGTYFFDPTELDYWVSQQRVKSPVLRKSNPTSLQITKIQL